MLRRLLLFRHAKSDWGTETGGDRERPLAPRGVEAARRVGRFLRALDLAPDIVLASPAVRARRTAEIALEAAGWALAVRIESGFYEGRGDSVLAVLRETASEVRTVLAVGHEPVWSELVSGLAGGGRVRFPTAALACLGLEADGWEAIGWGGTELRWLVTPRLLERWSLDG